MTNTMKTIKEYWFAVMLLSGLSFFPSCEKDTEDSNLGPEISVSADIIGMTGQTVNLSATASDPDGDALEYTWTIIESPAGSAPTLTNTSNNNATFTTPTAGFYRVEVVVDDGRGGEASDIVSLSIGGVLPTNMTANTVLPDLFPGDIPDYYATSSVTVRDGLTLEPGVVLECGSDVLLWVNGSSAYLKAEGTSDNRIVIRGVEKNKGHWRGISITSSNVNNNLDYVDIMHAGSSDNGARRAAIRLQSNVGARLGIQNTHISETDGHALFVDGSNGILTSYANNNFSDNEFAPVRLSAELVFALDKQSVYTNNMIQAIEVAAPGNTSSVFESSGTIKALSLPYHFLSSAIFDAAVTFEPGTVCLFNADLRLIVGTTGAIIADGTAASPIVISGLSQTPGSWRGIEISSPSGQNMINHAIISYGGSASGRGANIYMFGSQSARLTITNSTISHSQTYGIRASAGSTFLTESDNTFISNASGDIYQN